MNCHKCGVKLRPEVQIVKDDPPKGHLCVACWEYKNGLEQRAGDAELVAWGLANSHLGERCPFISYRAYILPHTPSGWWLYGAESGQPEIFLGTDSMPALTPAAREALRKERDNGE